MTSPKDSIYASPVGEVGAFKFDEKVANVFLVSAALKSGSSILISPRSLP